MLTKSQKTKVNNTVKTKKQFLGGAISVYFCLFQLRSRIFKKWHGWPDGTDDLSCRKQAFVLYNKTVVLMAASPVQTRFSNIVDTFRDDIESKIGDWTCGYSALISVLGYIGEDCINIQENKNKTHLDIGSGKGALCHLLSKHLKVGKVVGVDVVEKAIIESKNKYCLALQLPPLILDGPIQTTDSFNNDDDDLILEFELIERGKPFPVIVEQLLYDNISACFVISGLSTKQTQIDFLLNACNVLKDGGQLVILVNNPDTYGQQFTSIFLQGPNDIEESTIWEPGCKTKAIFSQDGVPYLTCNDRYWPR